MYYFKGNSNILGYKVDYKKSEEFRWSTALYTIEERCLVTHLIPNTKYRFRASCINSFGFSQFSWASEECETLTFGNSNITIQSELVEKLLSHHYDLIKTNQQWILIKKSNEEPKSIIIKKSEETKKSDQLGIQVIKPVVKPQPILQKIEESAENDEAKIIIDEPIKTKIKSETETETESTDFEKEKTKKIPSFKYAVEIVQKKIKEEKTEKKDENNENEQKPKKPNAFEKFKQAYLSQQEQKQKPSEPKTKYLQLY